MLIDFFSETLFFMDDFKLEIGEDTRLRICYA